MNSSHVPGREVAVHDALGGEVLHALGDAVRPAQEEARVEVGGDGAGDGRPQLRPPPDQEVLHVAVVAVLQQQPQTPVWRDW